METTSHYLPDYIRLYIAYKAQDRVPYDEIVDFRQKISSKNIKGNNNKNFTEV